MNTPACTSNACNSGRVTCPTPEACWLPLPEPERHDDTLNTFVIAMWAAVAIVCIVCAVIPALFA